MKPGQPSSRAVLSSAAACIAVFAAYVPITATSVALTPIQRGLNASSNDLTWIIDFLVLPMAAFILSAGTFADLFGRRRTLLGGLALLLIGSGLGLAAKSSIDLLFAAQATLGTGAALVLPTSLAVISHAIPDARRRAPAIGVWATSLMIALAAGLWFSTLVINTIGANWQWLYAAFLPWPLLAIALTAWGVEESTNREGRGFDPPGQLTAGLAIVAAVLAVIEGPVHGWGSALVVTSFAVAAAATLALVFVERRVRTPMLPPQLFGSPAFAVTGLVGAMLMFSLIGSMFLLVLFFGSAQHLTIAQISGRLVFLFGTTAVIAPIASKVAQRIGARPVLTIGLLVTAGGLFSLTGVQAGTAFGGLWWRMIISGLGVGMVFAPMTAAAVASVPGPLAGLAGSVNNAIRQTGGVLGPAVLSAVLTSRIVADLPSQLASQHVAAGQASRLTAQVRTQGTGAIDAIKPTAANQSILHATGNAYAYGLHVAVIIAVVALAATAVLTLLLLSPRPSSTSAPDPSASTEGKEDFAAAVLESSRDGQTALAPRSA